MKAKVLLVAVFWGLTQPIQSATISECQEMLRVGDYVQCLDAATEQIEGRRYGEEWPILKATAETELGRYLQAAATIDAGIVRYSWSIRLRMLAYDTALLLGDRQKSERMLDEINQLATGAPWRYTDADDLVSLGRAAIRLGADPKDVLEGFFDRATRNYKTRPDGFIAAAQLAMDKGDAALAAEIMQPAAKQFPDNPDVLFLLAESISSASAQEASALFQQILNINPNYAKALQKLAEGQIDAEDYVDAERTLAKIHAINPWHPRAHALQAVIHHLQNRPVEEARSRSRGLAFSDASPVVDHVIGEKLSRKYRFAEGAAYQQVAMAIDPLFVPAKTQLCQDLLRLGQDEAGWRMAEAAQKQDTYSTSLFNLMQLKDSLDDFQTLTNERFIIRMNRHEAIVYGGRVEALLNRAFEALSERYGYTPSEPVVVEIFDRPDDFAVRTFGIPDVAGFLGVCFGKLITANSPASQRNSPSNWESVLWHEFCHVITLQMTNNRIPRWLSEGISVYEERRTDVRWGQSMTPGFRERVKAGNVTPVSQLSSAFLHAESGEDLNFAYYESSMVVEFIVEQHGFEALVHILNDLQNGFIINDALERRAGGLTELDAAFAEYLSGVADSYAKDVEFSIETDGENEPDLEALQENPRHYTAGLSAAAALIRTKQLDAAEERLLQLIKLFPEDTSVNGARRILAVIYKRQEKTEQQAELLTEHLQRSGDDVEAAIELLSLQVTAEKWPQALKTSHLVMAIDPLQPQVLRQIHTVAAALKNDPLAIDILSGLLELEPADAARTHFLLAQILKNEDAEQSRRHVLLALEQAPRYRAAHKLLLDLVDTESTPR
ncbi:MAG: tetratricopeptide repeat protein [Fuerstiella sp.]|nr:tetratricopeptide repeat protein [Fuerstiella sp.]MCP4858469.1 tetratricopeptide repeat protein [Fuerstiella sp.]